MNWIKRLTCLLLGHVYRPHFRRRIYTLRGRGHVSEVRYTCERCGTPTPWMSKPKQKAFEEKYNPRWTK